MSLAVDELICEKVVVHIVRACRQGVGSEEMCVEGVNDVLTVAVVVVVRAQSIHKAFLVILVVAV